MHIDGSIFNWWLLYISCRGWTNLIFSLTGPTTQIFQKSKMSQKKYQICFCKTLNIIQHCFLIPTAKVITKVIPKL